MEGDDVRVPSQSFFVLFTFLPLIITVVWGAFVFVYLRDIRNELRRMRSERDDIRPPDVTP